LATAGSRWRWTPTHTLCRLCYATPLTRSIARSASKMIV